MRHSKQNPFGKGKSGGKGGGSDKGGKSGGSDKGGKGGFPFWKDKGDSKGGKKR